MSITTNFFGLGNNEHLQSDRILLTTDVIYFTDDFQPVDAKISIDKTKILIIKNEIPFLKLFLTDIENITFSSNSNEFLLQMFESIDYRFSCSKDRSSVLKMIVYIKTLSTLSSSNKSQSIDDLSKIKIFVVPEFSLDIYQTTDEDMRDSNLIRPDEKYAKSLTYKEFIDFEIKINEKKEANRKSIQPIYFKKGGKPITIDDFDLLKTLGKGAHGKVLLCQKKDVKNEFYALKIIKKKHIIDSNNIEHTIAEKMILSCLSHPFLVSLKHAFQSDRKIYFVMEFMKGGELFQHLRNQRRFSEEQTKFIAACVITALGHLHNKDYIYRDLKPENVLFDEKGFAKLTDFGLAKSLTINDIAKTFCGTPEYIAPEIILDKGCNREADWWSLGILIYELLFGMPPFYSEDVQEMYKKTLLETLKFQSKKIFISPEAKDFIAGLLIKSPKKRLGAIADSLEIMNHSWFKDFNWAKLLDRTLIPPYNPNSKEWEKHFDPASMNQKAFDSLCSVDPLLVQKFDQEFKVFDFNNETNNEMDKTDVNLNNSLKVLNEEDLTLKVDFKNMVEQQKKVVSSEQMIKKSGFHDDLMEEKKNKNEINNGKNHVDEINFHSKTFSDRSAHSQVKIQADLMNLDQKH